MIIFYDNFGRVKSTYGTMCMLYSFSLSYHVVETRKSFTLLDYLGVDMRKVECRSTVGGQLVDEVFHLVTA